MNLIFRTLENMKRKKRLLRAIEQLKEKATTLYEQEAGRSEVLYNMMILNLFTRFMFLFFRVTESWKENDDRALLPYIAEVVSLLELKSATPSEVDLLNSFVKSFSLGPA